MQLGRYTAKINGRIVSSNLPKPFVGPKPTNADILRLEVALMSLPGVDTSGGNVQHYFSDGLYARKLMLPAGSAIVGKIHLNGQINFLMKGTIRVTTDTGVEELTAPQIVVTGPGTKRAGYAITDVEWVTVSATDETDLDKIEDSIIAKSFDDPRLLIKLEALCLGEP
ncbi:hypothetical protein [Dickeya phage Amaethon]|nr:hypothetical protein [Dickeya phage Amaethon]